ncbi:MAG: hypothetical protein ACE5IO_06485 [Thermoplasmata archaeon]
MVSRFAKRGPAKGISSWWFWIATVGMIYLAWIVIGPFIVDLLDLEIGWIENLYIGLAIVLVGSTIYFLASRSLVRSGYKQAREVYDHDGSRR